MFPFELETYRSNSHDIDNMDEMFVTMVDFNRMLENRSNTMNSTATYQPANYQPAPQGYQMPSQAQAMPPAQDALPWEVSPADAVIANYNAQVAAGIPQSMPQYGPNWLAQNQAGTPQTAPQAMPQGYQQPAQQAQPVRREVPAGRYVCELADVRESTTKSGMPRISFAWRIVEGEYRGLWVWDNVTLGTPKGYEILGVKLAHIQPGWSHTDTADMYDEARAVRGWATARRYSVSKVPQDNGFFRIYADLIG